MHFPKPQVGLHTGRLAKHMPIVPTMDSGTALITGHGFKRRQRRVGVADVIVDVDINVDVDGYIATWCGRRVSSCCDVLRMHLAKSELRLDREERSFFYLVHTVYYSTIQYWPSSITLPSAQHV